MGGRTLYLEYLPREQETRLYPDQTGTEHSDIYAVKYYFQRNQYAIMHLGEYLILCDLSYLV